MSSGLFGNATVDAFDASLLLLAPLHEELGNRFELSAGTPRQLTDTNTVGSMDGVMGKAASFVAANSEYLTSSLELSRNKTKMSVSCWVYFDTLTASMQFFVFESTNTLGYGRIVVRKSIDHKLTVGMRDTSNGSLLSATSTNTFSEDTWYHVLAVLDTSADTIKAWVNGSEWINASVTMGAFYDAACATPMIHGCSIDGTGVPTYLMNGAIEQVGIWSDALTVDCATALYNSGAGLPYVPFSASRSCMWSTTLPSRAKKLSRAFARDNPFRRSVIDCNMFDAALDLVDAPPVISPETSTEKRFSRFRTVAALRDVSRSFRRLPRVARFIARGGL